MLCSTADRFVPGRREQLVFVTAMSAAAGTSRAGQALAKIPISAVQRRIPADRTRPDSFRRWARAEMGRHDWRLVAEAAGAIGTYDASGWIREIDVPTAVVVTTDDKAVPATEQARLIVGIPTASIHRIEDGHLACARPGFGRAIRAAVRDVADRIG